jgi:hypothetical protein
VRRIFSIKEKQNFLLGSALNARAAGLRFGSGAAEFHPHHLPPRPRFQRQIFSVSRRYIR